MNDALSGARIRLQHVQSRYGLRAWPRALAERRDAATEAMLRLSALALETVEGRRLRLAGYQDRLRALSPRRVLERGYCLVRRPDGTLLRVAADLAAGDSITVEFARGEADARVESVRAGEDDGAE